MIICKGDWVEITGGGEHTIGRMTKVIKIAALYYWLLDGGWGGGCRLKSNTTKYR